MLKKTGNDKNTLFHPVEDMEEHIYFNFLITFPGTKVQSNEQPFFRLV